MLCNIAVNDADYVVNKCPYYLTWSRMIKRCYDTSYLERKPSYLGVSVCENWLIFSKFKSWMEQQDWEGKELDKDLLCRGNKVYCPEACVFISRDLNLFVREKSDYKFIGATYEEYTGLYKAQITDPFAKRKLTLGRFNTIERAHEEWRKYKHRFAKRLAKMQSDPRVINALLIRYSKDVWYGS